MTLIVPLDLSGTELLDEHLRTCVRWELAGGAGADAGGTSADATSVQATSAAATAADAEFEKEAWFSRVLLEWGVCGQLARVGERTVGAALYAPPGMVPGAAALPTSPVSADAVLLTALREEDAGVVGDAVRGVLLDAVVADLRTRGVRALEAFGHTVPQGAPAGPRGCGDVGCMTRTEFLLEHDFHLVADHPEYPRLRRDIEPDHLWKADVEHALDQLFAERGIPHRVFGLLAGVH